MNTEMKEYKGVECIVNDNKIKYAGYVVSVDREIGITIHDDNDSPLYCINKKELFNRSLRSRKDRNKIYHEAFTKIIEMIKKGVLINIDFDPDLEMGFEIKESNNIFANMLNCPFK